MRKLNAALTLRSLRHGKEHTLLLLEDDDQSFSSKSSSSNSDDSTPVSAKTSNNLSNSSQKKGTNKVRSIGSSITQWAPRTPKKTPTATPRRKTKASLDKSLPEAPFLEPSTPNTRQRTMSSDTATTAISSGTPEMTRSKSSGNMMGMMFLADMKGSEEFFEYHEKKIGHKSDDEGSKDGAPTLAKKRSTTPFRKNREKKCATPLTPHKKTPRRRSVATEQPRSAEIDISSNLDRLAVPKLDNDKPASTKSRSTTPFRRAMDIDTKCPSSPTKVSVKVQKITTEDKASDAVGAFVQLDFTDCIDTSSHLNRLVKPKEITPSPPASAATPPAPSPADSLRKSTHGTTLHPTTPFRSRVTPDKEDTSSTLRPTTPFRSRRPQDSVRQSATSLQSTTKTPQRSRTPYRSSEPAVTTPSKIEEYSSRIDTSSIYSRTGLRSKSQGRPRQANKNDALGSRSYHGNRTTTTSSPTNTRDNPATPLSESRSCRVKRSDTENQTLSKSFHSSKTSDTTPTSLSRSFHGKKSSDSTPTWRSKSVGRASQSPGPIPLLATSRNDTQRRHLP